jgi:hypothetical protein
MKAVSMAEYCSCGVQLPPDAVFCHKCGKPQREIITPEIEENTYLQTPVVEIPPPRPQPMPMGFRNPVALRTSLLAAVLATLPGILLPLIGWLAAGFFAVYLYCRRTGFRLDVVSGVKIGWITGLLLYLFTSVVFTVQQIPDALAGHLGKTMVDQLKNSPIQDPMMTSMFQQNPGQAILVLLAAMFVFVTCLSMAGGALGAKLVGSSK